MKNEEKKKSKLGQMLWIGVVLAGNILVLMAMFQFFWKVSTPRQQDATQTISCGSLMTRNITTSNAEDNTNVACKDVMEKRGRSVLLLMVGGFVVSTFGAVMLGRPLVMKKRVEKKDTEE